MIFINILLFVNHLWDNFKQDGGGAKELKLEIDKRVSFV